MILGNGRIGKTQIANRLRAQAPIEATGRLHPWHSDRASADPWPLAAASSIIWDFGGQDIYHGTHALFLKSHAVFMLVWTPDSEETPRPTPHNGMEFRNQRLPWWLDYVRRFGEQPLASDRGAKPARQACRSR